LKSAGTSLDERIGSFIAGTRIIGAAEPVDEDYCCARNYRGQGAVGAAADIGPIKEVQDL
jgi:hypothetical protein